MTAAMRTTTGRARGRRHDLPATVRGVAAAILGLLGPMLGGPASAQPAPPRLAAAEGAAAGPRPSAAELLPRRTVFLATSPSIVQLREHFQASNTGRMVADPEIRPFLSGIWKVFADEFADRVADRELDVTLDELVGIPAGEIAVAGVAIRGEGIELAAIFDVDPKTDVTERLMLWGRAQGESDPLIGTTDHRGFEIQQWRLNPTGDDSLRVCRRGDTYLVSTSLNLLHGMLDLWDGIAIDVDGDPVPTLAKSSQFITITRRLGGGLAGPPDVLLYADPIEGVRAAYGETPAGFAAMAMIPALGLDGLRAVGASVAFHTEDFDAILRLHVMMDRPRFGVLEAIALGEVDPTPADFVPADVTDHLVGQIDREATVEAARKVYDSYFGADALSKWIKANVSENVGIDVEKEFLPLVTGRIAYATWTGDADRFNGAANLVAVRVTDPAAMRALVVRVVDSGDGKGAEEDRPVRAEHGGVEYWMGPDRTDRIAADRERRQAERARRAEQEGRPAPEVRFEMAARPTREVIALIGEDLVICDDEAFFKHAVDAYRGDAPRFRDSLPYLAVATRVRRILGSQKAALVGVNNAEEDLKRWYEFAAGTQARQFLDDRGKDSRFLGRLGATMTATPLPSLEKIKSYVAASGSVLIDEETGLHYMSFTIRREPETPPTP